MNKNDLKKFLLDLFDEIAVKFDESQMVICYRLGKTDPTIVKFLNCKGAEAVSVRKKLSPRRYNFQSSQQKKITTG